MLVNTCTCAHRPSQLFHCCHPAITELLEQLLQGGQDVLRFFGARPSKSLGTRTVDTVNRTELGSVNCDVFQSAAAGRQTLGIASTCARCRSPKTSTLARRGSATRGNATDCTALGSAMSWRLHRHRSPVRAPVGALHVGASAGNTVDSTASRSIIPSPNAIPRRCRLVRCASRSIKLRGG